MKSEKIKPKQTIKNLNASYKTEMKAAHFYLKAAEIAKAEGESEAAGVFRDAAKEEKEHLRKIEKLLHKLRD